MHWNCRKKHIQTAGDGAYREQNGIIERFVLSLMDPGEKCTACDRWRLGKSSLEDDFCMKAPRAMCATPVKAVQLLDELGSEYEEQVAAFNAP